MQIAERAIAAAFERQGREFLGRLAKRKDQFPNEVVREATARDLDWEQFWREVELATLAVLEEPIGTVLEAALEAGIRAALADFKVGLDFSLEHPRATAFLSGRAAERVTLINETTREELRTLLTEAMENGWSYQKTAKVLKERFAGFAGKRPQAHIQSRAHMVAVTEAGEAYEEGSLQVAKELAAMGLEMEKAWHTVGDARVSVLCRGNQGAGWIPIDAVFPSGHDRPLGHPACRCAALYRRKSDKD